MELTETALVTTILVAMAGAGQPVRLHRYPQKVVTFSRANTADVPFRPAAAGNGATWTLEAGELWRTDPKAPVMDRRQYFGGRRYIPEGEITGLAPDTAGGVWVRTRTGVSHIALQPMTLAEKAAVFEQRISARHVRHGFTADSRLTEAGNLATNRTVSSDNDGLWTAMYVSAELFRYAVTKSGDALERARRGLEAVLFLEQITGIPGFPARSYIDAGEERPKDGFWFAAADGRRQWKADTSSDEIVGHMLVFGLAWDLLPANDPLRQRVQATCRRVMDHIIDHGYYLVDRTGKPTKWGRWSKEYFASKEGRPDSPLNAIELLSFLKTAQHVTGEPKYAAEYRKVAFDLGYAEIGTRYLALREELNYSDEELAMLSFYPLFAYEKDAHYLDLYRRAADQWWENEKRELNPLWTFIYALGRPEAAPDSKAPSGHCTGCRWTW